MSTNVRRWLSRVWLGSQGHTPTRSSIPTPLSLVTLEDRMTPALFTVLNTNDSGTGSLREAIAFANKLPGADTIQFLPGLTGTISLQGQMTITEPVSIIGPGSGKLSISNVNNAAPTSRILLIDQNSPGNAVSLSGLTIAGGKVAGGANPNGGAILNIDSALTLNDVVLDSNSTSGAGGAISLEETTSSLTATNSVFRTNSATGSGGALLALANSSISISSSTFSNNKSALSGGGIALQAGGQLTINQSTFSANQAGTNPGEVGGGLAAFSGALIDIIGSTFSANSASQGGGVALAFGSSLVASNSTFTLNVATSTSANSAGGIAQLTGSTANITLRSTVVAQNTSTLTAARDLSSSSNSATADNSFIGVLQPGLNITGSGNITGTTGTPALAQLGSLQNNGGTTQTHAPMVGSPLLDAGSNLLGLQADQRGASRVINGSPDIGAVEGGNPVAELTLAPDVAVPGATSYNLTITYKAANTATISLASLGVNDITVTGPAGPVTVASLVSTTQAGTPLGIVTTATYSLTPPGGSWAGTSNGLYTVSINPNSVLDSLGRAVVMPGTGQIGAFRVVIPQTFTVTNLNDSGIGSLRDALTLANSGLPTPDTINFIPGLVGTISLTSPLVITDSVTINGTGAKLLFLDGQSAERVLDINGPGVINVNINNLAVQNGNPITGNGGGIRIANEVVTLDTVQVISNKTSDLTSTGGGIAVETGGMLRLLNSLVANNQSSADGGGLSFADTSTFRIENSSIIGNTSNTITSGLGGGGIAFNGMVANGTLPTGFVDSELLLINSTIGQNLSPDNGGGLMLNVSSGSLRATNSTITNNTATLSTTGFGGGGIYRNGLNGGIILENSVVAANSNANTPDIGVTPAFSAIIADSSLIGSSTGLVITGLNNQSGSNQTPLSPMLGSLTTNGKFSGILLNYEPLEGSPLLDKGNNVTVSALGLTGDQRSTPFVRVFNSKVDIGAIERQPRPNFGIPTLDPTNAAPAVFTESAGPVAVDNTLNVFDNVDDPQQFSKITVQISGNYQSGSDLLAVTPVGNLTSSFDASTGTLTISSPSKDSAANFSSTLATLTFNNTSLAPNLMDRTLTIIATDATDASIPQQSSLPITRTVQIIGINNAPVITVPSASPSVQVSKAIVISGVSVSDVDAGSGNVTMTVSVAPGVGTFTGVGFTSGSGTNSITVTDTLANVNTALTTLTFTAGTILGNATVTVEASDNGNTPGAPETDTKTFIIGITTEPPQLTVSPGTLGYIERQGSANIDPGLVLSDDSDNIGAAYVEITSGFAAAEDQLSLLGPAKGGIAVDTSIPGKISFTGIASVADYQDALRNVAFANTSFDPSTALRTITFTVEDPTDPITVSGTRQISVTSVNDAPSFVAPPAGPFAVATDSKFEFTGSKAIQVTDPDGRSSTQQVFLSVISGLLTVTPSGNVQVNGNNSTTITMKGSLVDLNATLSTLYFTAPSTPLTVTLSGGINDLGNNGSIGGAQSADLPPINLNVLGFPRVSSVSLQSLNPSKADTVDFLVTFDQPVVGVDSSDFALSVTGISDAKVSSVSGSGAKYTVAVATGTGSGAIRLDLIDNDTITNGATPLGGPGAGNGNFTTGPLAIIDRTGPSVSVSRAPGQASPTKDSPLRFLVTFNEPVTGFDASKLNLSPAGLGATVTGSGANYIVAVSGMSTATTVSVSVPAGVVVDSLGNLSTASTGDGTVVFDPTLGTVPPPPPPPISPPVVPPPPTPPVVPPPVSPPVVVSRDLLAIAPGAGGGPDVRVFNPDGSERLRFFGGDLSNQNGLSIATGDVTGDGIDDIITGAGAGSLPLIRIYDGVTGALLQTILAFDQSFQGGINVAAGDLTGDGKADIVVGAGVGGGPHIRVFDSTGGQLATYFAYSADFRGGVNVAVGKLDGNAPARIIAGAGVGGGPHIRTFDAMGTPGVTFFAYDPNFRGGVNVGAADLDGDGKDEILAGAGNGGGPQVRVFTGDGFSLGSFFAFNPSFRGGVRVAGQDLDGDGKDELVTAAGPGGGPAVQFFTTSFTATPTPTPIVQTPAPVAPPVNVRSFFAYDPSFLGGVFIG